MSLSSRLSSSLGRVLYPRDRDKGDIGERVAGHNIFAALTPDVPELQRRL